MKKILGALVITVCASAATSASAGDRWIHLRVDDADGGNGRVDIQVPVGMVQSLLPVLKGVNGGGSIRVDSRSLDIAELREYWTAVRNANDGEYVTVRDQDSNVRIAKRAGHLLLNVDDEGGKSRVRMKVPVPMIDAVLTGRDTLDLNALGIALANAPDGELLSVDDEGSHVRIWIDGAAAPAREDGR
jgi:hypothetical protein